MHLWNVPLLFAPKCNKKQKKTVFFNTKGKLTKEKKTHTHTHKKMRQKKREESKLQGR